MKTMIENRMSPTKKRIAITKSGREITYKVALSINGFTYIADNKEYNSIEDLINQ